MTPAETERAGDAAAALATAEAARSEMARRVEEGGALYDALYAGLVAVIVGGQALSPAVAALSSAAGSVGLVALATTWARRTGVFVCGVQPRRAKWAAFAVAGVAIFGAAAANLGARLGYAYAAPTAALVAAAAAFGLSRVWRRLYRTDLQESSRRSSRVSNLVLMAALSAVCVALAPLFAALHMPAEFVGWTIGVAVGGFIAMAAVASRRLRLRP